MSKLNSTTTVYINDNDESCLDVQFSPNINSYIIKDSELSLYIAIEKDKFIQLFNNMKNVI